MGCAVALGLQASTASSVLGEGLQEAETLKRTRGLWL